MQSLCFSETWLHDKITDASVTVECYKLYRVDRQKETGKKKGGLSIYVNKKWCHPNNTTMKYTHCSPVVEMMTVSACPYYLPRKFSHVIVTNVYVPPTANARGRKHDR